MRPRRGLMAVAVLLGLVMPATAGAVTVPQAVSFPPTRTGADSSVVVAFAAEGGTELMGTAVLDGDPALTTEADTCSGQEVSGTCTIAVRFAPTAAGAHTATLRLGGARGEAVVALTGTAYAVGPQLAVSPDVLSFQPLSPGLLSSPKRVTVTAGGDLPARITGVAFEGPAPGDFVVTLDGCSRTVLVPGTSCVIEVRSNPSSPGGSVARLRVLADPPAVSKTVGLIALPPNATGPPSPPSSPRFSPPPWSLGIVAVVHTTRQTTVRLYTSLPAVVTVKVRRGQRTVRRRSRRIPAGVVKVIVKGRLRRGRYRVEVAAARSSERRRDSVRLRVR